MSLFHKISGIEKNLGIRGGGGEGGITIFFRKLFCLTVPENFVGNTFLFDKISGIEKI